MVDGEKYWLEERKWLSSCQTFINPSALVGYVAKNRFLCVSVICGKASFPDQRIDLQLLSAGRRRVSFSAPNASQQCGAFLFGAGAGDLPGGWEPRPVQPTHNQSFIIRHGPNLEETGFALIHSVDEYEIVK